MSIQKQLEKFFPLEFADDTEEVILDTVNIPELTESDKSLLEKYTNAILLSFTACGLKNLKNLPKLDLKILELNDNKIKGEELSKLSVYPNLSKLRLSNNPISAVNELKSLQNLTHLELLDLTECPITKIQNYRTEVFNLLPNLKILDSMYKDGALYESEFGEDEEGEEFDDDQDFLEDEEIGEDDEDFEDEEEEEDAKPTKKRRTD